MWPRLLARDSDSLGDARATLGAKHVARPRSLEGSAEGLAPTRALEDQLGAALAGHDPGRAAVGRPRGEATAQAVVALQGRLFRLRGHHAGEREKRTAQQGGSNHPQRRGKGEASAASAVFSVRWVSRATLLRVLQW